MPVKYIFLAVLVLFDRELIVSSETETKNVTEQNTVHVNETKVTLISENDPIGNNSEEGRALVNKKAKTYNNNKRKQQFNVQIIAEPDPNQSYLDRYKKKNYLPSNIITKANFTKNKYGEIDDYDYQAILNDPTFDKNKKPVKKKRKKVTQASTVPNTIDIYYQVSTTTPAPTTFIESTPEKIGNADITPSLLAHMLNIHQSATNVKKDRDYYKYLVESEYPRPFVTEQTVFPSSTTLRPLSSRPLQPNILFFTTTTTTTSPADIPSPISAHFSNYGVTIPPRPTLQSTTVEDSIKRPTYSTPPIATTTTPVIDLNAYMLRLLKNDTNKDMFRDLLNLNCTGVKKKEEPPKAPVKKKKKKIVFVKKPQKQADHEEDEEEEEKGIEVVTEVNDVTISPNTAKDNYILLKPIIDELIANQSSDRKKGVAYFEIKSDEVEESDESEYILEKIPEVKDKDSHKKHTKKKKHKKKKKKEHHHHDHHHHKKKKKKKHGHHHHDYDYKKKVKKGKKKKVIKKKGCHSKEEHNYHYYIYKKGDKKESDEHEYHDKSESYEKHKHHKKKKHHHHHHHHKKHEDDSYEHEHDSYEYRTIAKRDVNASSNIVKRNANDTKKVLRTKIHVTSEFANPDVQSTTAPSLEFNDTKSRKPYDDGKRSSQETSSYEDDYPTFDMGFDDDYDSRDVSQTREEEDSEYYSDEYPRKKMKPENSKRPYSYEESNSKPTKKKRHSKYDDDYYDEPEGFFDMVFGSISRFFSSFMPMPMSKKSKRKNYDSYEDYSDEDGTARSTTPRVEYRRPKKPSLKMEQRRPKDPWYYPSYLFSSSENNEIVVLPTSSPLMGVTTTEKNSWISNLNPLKIFSIFTSQDENQISSPSTLSPTESSGEGMFDWMPNFLSPATTTSPPPPVISHQPDSIQINLPKPLQDPSTWVGILQALQNATLSTTTEPSYNFLPPPKTNQPVMKSYANHQVWRVLPRTQDHVNSLTDHKQGEYGEKLTWLKGPSLRGPTDVIVDPDNLETFKEFLDDEGIPFDITVWDLEKAINYENPPLRYNMMSAEHPLTWYHYHRYSDILKFLEYLQRNFPRNVELIPIGSSYEGMPLVVVKIFANDDHLEVAQQRKNDKKSHTNYKKQSKMRKRKAKPAIFVEAGAHGREWIGPASATWIINHLLDLIHKNNSLNETISAIDWYIMPVLNPDGYEYSHIYDRMWRKTRTKVEKKDGLLTAAMNWLQTDDDDPEQIAALKKYCYGTDLNRNWDDSWGVVGTSQDPCSDYYAGASPFSEPESKALSKFLMEHKKRIKIYVSLHAYGQLIAYPPSPSYAYVNERYDDLFDMAMVSLEKLRNSGSPTKYLIDTSSDMIYHRSGSSDSYAMHHIGIPYAFTIELRGTNGPILPANQIEMAAAEAFYLIQGMVDYIF